MSSEPSAHRDSDPLKNAPLPEGWTRQYSKSNAKYFYHHKNTNVTQWHFPTASEAKDPNVAKKRAEEAQEREKKRAMSTTSASSSANDQVSRNDSNKVDSYSASTKRPRTDISSTNNNLSNPTLDLADKTCVAIIVPYRDIHVAQQRAAHLKKFIPHMISFLNRCKKELQCISDYHIYIIEQSDDQRKFNRGKLLNIGFDIARTKFAKRNHDVFIFHDVDLLPDQDLAVWYTKFPKFPIHIARVWDRYSGNPKYFGGVVSFSSSDYKRINGVRCGFALDRLLCSDGRVLTAFLASHFIVTHIVRSRLLQLLLL
jgi:N-terminal region of glycosyl transferase group 7/WW domain/N-terminal domain of galactosyltransferase